MMMRLPQVKEDAVGSGDLSAKEVEGNNQDFMPLEG
jgi:hypothetical protein